MYRHSLVRAIIYSEGIKEMAEEHGAYWLIDAVASYYASPQMDKAILADSRLELMQFWTLKAEGGKATLTMNADSGEPNVITQEIEFTDFPDGEQRIWASNNGDGWTLFLPEEY